MLGEGIVIFLSVCNIYTQSFTFLPSCTKSRTRHLWMNEARKFIGLTIGGKLSGISTERPRSFPNLTAMGEKSVFFHHSNFRNVGYKEEECFVLVLIF